MTRISYSPAAHAAAKSRAITMHCRNVAANISPEHDVMFGAVVTFCAALTFLLVLF